MKITDQESDKAFYQEMESFLRTDCYSYMHLFKIWSKAIAFANTHKSESIAKSFEEWQKDLGFGDVFDEVLTNDDVDVIEKTAYTAGFEAGLKQGREG